MSFDQEKFLAETKCEVCGGQGIAGVASSVLGPISLAYCIECLTHRADAEWLFEHTYWSTREGHVADWVRELYTYRDGAYISWDDWVEGLRADPERNKDPFADYEPSEELDFEKD